MCYLSDLPINIKASKNVFFLVFKLVIWSVWSFKTSKKSKIISWGQILQLYIDIIPQQCQAYVSILRSRCLLFQYCNMQLKKIQLSLPNTLGSGLPEIVPPCRGGIRASWWSIAPSSKPLSLPDPGTARPTLNFLVMTPIVYHQIFEIMVK